MIFPGGNDLSPPKRNWWKLFCVVEIIFHPWNLVEIIFHGGNYFSWWKLFLPLSAIGGNYLSWWKLFFVVEIIFTLECNWWKLLSPPAPTSVSPPFCKISPLSWKIGNGESKERI